MSALRKLPRRSFLQIGAAGLALAASRAVGQAPATTKPPGEPTRFQIACMTLPYNQFPLARALSGIKSAGYQYVAWGTTHKAEGQAKGAPVMPADAPPKQAKELGDRCRDLGLTLATAESCTGGKIAERLTSVAGSSEVFVGAIVSYADRVKTEQLGVPAEMLQRFGAVRRAERDLALALALTRPGPEDQLDIIDQEDLADVPHGTNAEFLHAVTRVHDRPPWVKVRRRTRTFFAPSLRRYPGEVEPKRA